MRLKKQMIEISFVLLSIGKLVSASGKRREKSLTKPLSPSYVSNCVSNIVYLLVLKKW